MRKEGRKKVIASFELTLMFLSMFAFSYMVSETNEYFKKPGQEESDGLSLFSGMKTVWDIFIKKIKSPIIPLVSADEDTGCCALRTDNVGCASALRSECESGFMPGIMCDSPQDTVCNVGCCHEISTGHYAPSIESLCTSPEGEWDSTPCEDNSDANVGCCVIRSTAYTSRTRDECRILSEQEGLETTDWRYISEAECTYVAEAQEMGACVLPDKYCKFITRHECESLNGDFHIDHLCTDPDLDTTCEVMGPTGVRTTCVDGKDQVYFMDTCDNLANVYDTNKLPPEENWDYWTTVQEPDCGVSDANGNAGSLDCGNCNSGRGGTCALASEDDVNPGEGDYYCQDIRCEFDFGTGEPEIVQDGESWCEYDSKVGDGDDVVGSSHWRYQCSQGEILVDRCGNNDYRDKICVDTTPTIDGTKADFKMASCIPNNWRKCILINNEYDDDEDIIRECEAYPGCAMEYVDVANYFNFSICRPEYPPGFDLAPTANVAADNEEQCGMVTVEATIPRQPEMGSGCRYTEDEDGELMNVECTTQEFTRKMNELCKSMGDCGGSVNINGYYDQGFVIGYNLSDMENGNTEYALPTEAELKTATKTLNATNIETLTNLILTEYKFQTVEEDYTELLEASGLLDSSPESGDYESWTRNPWAYIAPGGIAATLASVMGAVGAVGGAEGVMGSIMAGLSTTAAAPLLGAFIGAGIGVTLGLLIADQLGFSQGSTIMLTISLGVAGLGLGVATGTTAATAVLSAATVAVIPVVGWIIFGAALLTAIIAVGIGANEDDCLPIEIEYKCQVYEPPVGGEYCHLCNEELSDGGQRTCTDYRCESLGQACIIINEGTEYEECAAIPNDGSEPRIIGADLSQDDNVALVSSSTAGYAEIKPASGKDCFDAGETITVGVEVTEPVKCRFSDIQKPYDEMEGNTFGVLALLPNQTMSILLEDPSGGRSSGVDASKDIEFYVKCQDGWGDITPEPFRFNFCVYEGEDTRAPLIESYSPTNGGLTSFDLDEQEVTIMTDDVAQCRWATTQVGYDDMPANNNFSCTGDSSLTYDLPHKCTTILPTPDPVNTFYINCKDQPWLENIRPGDRNSKYTSEEYVLKKPEKRIQIDWIEPNEDIKTGSLAEDVTLKVKTSGGGDYHNCKWSLSGYKDIEMFPFPIGANVGNLHTVTLTNLVSDTTRTVRINCSDETGDMASSSSTFKINLDNSPPKIVRISQKSGKIYITTDEPAKCKYSTETCNFDWDEAPVMNGNFEFSLTAVKGQRYYIKCEDIYGKKPTLGCTAEIMAV